MDLSVDGPKAAGVPERSGGQAPDGSPEMTGDLRKPKALPPRSRPSELCSTTNVLDRPFDAILEPISKGPKILAFLAVLKVAIFCHLQGRLS